ncbi:hypothetical protein HK100_003740 [Physocladia obscura]|uniref:Calponin-homology (CH) domain-containing protein n=1 Tax=Physocladia obscura TaxID=109957 RepID=A0AAD5X974_9FUNG|nr:hypothetical protein HK100_003740 [Physocladia obscura]
MNQNRQYVSAPEDDEGTALYGLDKELAEKAALKYDPRRETEARQYIEQITGYAFPSDNFQESLKDGFLLCEMINRINAPNDQIKIQTSKMPFKQMENIGAFLDRVEKLGVPAHERFMTVDLFEAKNMSQVVNCIFSLSRHASAKGFDGPILGPKLAEKNERQFTDEQLREAKFMPSKLMALSTAGTGFSGGNSGGRREIGGKYVELQASSDALNSSAAPAIENSSSAASTRPSRNPTPARNTAATGYTPIKQTSGSTDYSSSTAGIPQNLRTAETLPLPQVQTFVPPPRNPRSNEIPIDAPFKSSRSENVAPPLHQQPDIHSFQPSSVSLSTPLSDFSPARPARGSREPRGDAHEREKSPGGNNSATRPVFSPTPEIAKETPAPIPKASGLSITQFKTYAEYKAAKAALEASAGGSHNGAGVSSNTGGARNPRNMSAGRSPKLEAQELSAPAISSPSTVPGISRPPRRESAGKTPIVRQYVQRNEESDDEVAVFEEE